MAWFTGFGRESAASACETGDICALLTAVLPVFIEIAERTRNNLPDDSSLDKTWTFYLHFNAKVVSLNAVLVQWDPAETVQRTSKDEKTAQKNLMRILHELEDRFISHKVEKAARAFECLGFKRRQGETYPKLRALRRTLPHDDTLNERFLNQVDCIVRVHKKNAEKQEMLLQNLGQALDFFYDLRLSTSESDTTCPIWFSDYPLKHVQKLANTLFDVVRTNWCCQCSSSASHVSRKTRLNLTQYQRFETTPVGRQIFNKEARFRILFPTNSPTLQWQDTEIAVTEQDYVKDYHVQPKNGLCGVIQGVKPRIRPRMIVYGQSLWQLHADPETDQSSCPQVRDSEFISLRDLIRPVGSNRASLLSSIQGKDRLILSFILATSLLHFIYGPWLQTSLSSDNICFLLSNRRSLPDITKPYLTTSFTSLTRPPLQRDLNQPHPFPDILSLGILLLEIARAAPVEFEEPQDPCVVALECRDKWTKECRTDRSRTVPEGLCRAISACIEPKESRSNGRDKNSLKDAVLRKFIFERVLYPLGDALSIAYKINVNTLHADIGRATELRGTGSIDHQGESRQDKQEAGDEWIRHLSVVHELFDKCDDRCYGLREAAKKETRVKVAVLDTGLQLPGAFQENYEDAERINCNHSASFLPIRRGQSPQEWKVDCDGHGSRVGEIILNVAPTADLHIAKVFKARGDLADPKMAEQVHKRIAEAINCATNEWKVDMIVMCFGFEEPIPLIRKAIDRASKAEKPPLFFAATCNDGAHKRMAWPAREMSVIGVSSTAGDGSVSAFNPSENMAHPILYAFGEGVPVNVTAPGKPDESILEYVSGTSYATPVAAALAANLLGCIRMAVETCSPEDRASYSHVPVALQRMGDMVTVLRRHMQKRHLCGVESLLPWDFLNVEMLDGNRILKDVAETLRKG